MTAPGRTPFEPFAPAEERPEPTPARRPGWIHSAVLVVAGGMIGGGVVAAITAATDDEAGGSTAALSTAPSSAGSTEAESPNVQTGTVDYSAVYEQAAKGTVSVRTTVRGGGRVPFGGREDGVAGGTGFVVDTEGTILTNQHVVANATRVDVTFADGTSVRAKVVGEDAATDVAVLDVDVSQDRLRPLKLADSSKVEVGDTALAIGDPYGYTRTLTVGVVSGLDRSIEAPNGFTISGAIQTDAQINSGNSGGPLLNAKGEVIGVNAQIAGSAQQGNVGIGFAVASNTADRVLKQISDTGEAKSAWLGVSLDDVDGTLAGNDGVGGARSGALVTAVAAGGPGAEAGLKGGSTAEAIAGEQRCLGGDVITAADGTQVTDASDLQNVVSSKKPGDSLRIDVTRATGAKATLTVDLDEQPEQAPEAPTGC